MSSQANQILPEASGIGGNAMAKVLRIFLIPDCVPSTLEEQVALVVGPITPMEVMLKIRTIKSYFM